VEYANGTSLQDDQKSGTLVNGWAISRRKRLVHWAASSVDKLHTLSFKCSWIHFGSLWRLSLRANRCKNEQKLDAQLLQPFNGLFSRTTWVSRYQKGKTHLDLNEARDDGVLSRAFQFAIWFDSLCKSIWINLFCKKSAFRFTSCHAVFLAYLLYSLSQKISLHHCLRRLILWNIYKKQLRNAYYKNYS